MTPLDRSVYEMMVGAGFRRLGANLFVIDRSGNSGILFMTRAKYSAGGWTDMVPHLAVVSERLTRIGGASGVIDYPEPDKQAWYRSGFNIHRETDRWNALSETDSTTWAAALVDLAGRL